MKDIIYLQNSNIVLIIMLLSMPLSFKILYYQIAEYTKFSNSFDCKSSNIVYMLGRWLSYL